MKDELNALKQDYIQLYQDFSQNLSMSKHIISKISQKLDK